ncbi:hypothetical protein MUK72_15710 (plasmid) [Halococcus dombrowskii]|uniref:Uncharacterized protein n=1 Tax=Halococcus dombrowskii TaxID=179637 RepID=A0AAV3SE85_HALDO|nr:hypothetical protein [Halococcus dombrowskii]UOO96639.1 hypothetical protein MUK72_15710 [Halococcus dombrowskii]
MRASTAFQECATLLDEIEATGVEVNAITPREDDLLEEGSVTVDLSLGVPLLDEIETNGIEITSQSGDALTDGTLTVDVSARVPLDRESADQPSETQPEIDLPESEKEIISDGSGTQPQTAAKPYQDPDRLREVYDDHETFAEMTDALDVDVTAETVRTNMIKHGIHEPASQSSAPDERPANDDESSPAESESDGDAGTDAVADETELPDGAELPEGITLNQLKTSVQSARSFLDVQRELGGDRDVTYQLLKEFNLLDLVHGRLSKQAERTISDKQIDQRIRQSVSQHSQPTARSD